MIAAGLLARNANKLGLVRKPWVKSSLAPGSKAVTMYLEEAGLMGDLEKLGFGVVAYACTSCNGMSGALDPKIQQEIIDRDLYATAVLSGNRNFDGRIHPYAKQAFLASPPLVVAYAIAGTVRFDIEKDVLTVVDGKEIRLKDIWPTDEEIDAIVKSSVKPEHFRKVYEPMFAIRADSGTEVKPLYDWRPQSTYIRRPPYWEGALAGERTMKGMRPLALLPDNITTDHLSPSNAILMNSAAGEYLHKMGLPEEDFNSYATHRGDHLTAQRATFANPTLVNEMAIVDGKVKKGSLARVEPEGKVMRMWEAIETYMNRKQPLIIVAGADYGQGSSRDWAAKGVRLAGVEAIVAEGFERIHRTNLIGMGVLPLEFKAGVNRKTLALDGTETYDVIGTRKPRADLTLAYEVNQIVSIVIYMTLAYIGSALLYVLKDNTIKANRLKAEMRGKAEEERHYQKTLRDVLADLRETQRLEKELSAEFGEDVVSERLSALRGQNSQKTRSNFNGKPASVK